MEDRCMDSDTIKIGSSFNELAICYNVLFNGEERKPLTLVQNGRFVEAAMAGCLIKDRIREEENFFTITRTWTIDTAGNWKLLADIHLTMDPPEVFIPTVFYKQNDRGIGSFPKGKDAGFWSYSEDRTPLPACIILDRDDTRYGFYKKAAENEHMLSSRSLKIEDRTLRIRTMIPGEEFPYSYRGKNRLDHTSEFTPEYLKIGNEELPYKHTEEFYIYKDRQKSSIFSFYKRMLDRKIEYRELSKGKKISWETYLDLKMKHLLFLTREDGLSGFNYITMGLGNGPLQKIYNFTAGSFLVKSLEAACVLAEYGGAAGNRSLLRVAENIGFFFLKGEISEGVHQDCFDLEKRYWGGYLGISENDKYRFLINARCNGETMSGYIRLYQTLAEYGKEIDEFIALPERVAKFYLDNFTAFPDAGAFGRWWSKEGTPENSLGTNGAYIVSYLLLLLPYSMDKKKLLDSLMVAADHYCLLVDEGDFYGDTLDADAYDKESGAVLLSMFLDLYEFDKNEKWLTYAKKCADYLLTWIWQYDIPFSDSSPLGKAGFHSTGMTSVSIAHHHLDFYGISIGYDFLRLWQHCRSGLYKQNAHLMIDACRQLIATEEESLGKGPEFAGWQPEQINHSLWDYFNRDEHVRGHYDICIAWVTVLGLGALLKIRKRFPEILEEEELS